MEVIEIHTQAENGHVSFDLPAGHEALANARLRIVLQPEPTASVPIGHTGWDALARAYEALEGHDPYPTITDAVTWQRELRANDEREFDR